METILPGSPELFAPSVLWTREWLWGRKWEVAISFPKCAYKGNADIAGVFKFLFHTTHDGLAEVSRSHWSWGTKTLGMRVEDVQLNRACLTDNTWLNPISFPLTSGRNTRALGATISGMRHRCGLRSEPDEQNSVISFVISKWLLPELSFSDRWNEIGLNRVAGQSRSQSLRYPCPAERGLHFPFPLDKGNKGSGNEIGRGCFTSADC